MDPASIALVTAGLLAYALVSGPESDSPHGPQIFSISVITVALSVVLHGLSAAPLAAAYGHLAKRVGDCEETLPVPELPLRNGPQTTE